MAKKKTPGHDDIAAAAYRRYLERGGSHGGDFNDWLEAERELMARSAATPNSQRPTPKGTRGLASDLGDQVGLGVGNWYLGVNRGSPYRSSSPAAISSCSPASWSRPSRCSTCPRR